VLAGSDVDELLAKHDGDLWPRLLEARHLLAVEEERGTEDRQLLVGLLDV